MISVYQFYGAAVMYVKFVWQIATFLAVFLKAFHCPIKRFVGPKGEGPTE